MTTVFPILESELTKILTEVVRDCDAPLLAKVICEEAKSTVPIADFSAKVKGILERQIQQWDNEEIVGNETKLNSIVEIIRVLRNSNIPIDLSTLPVHSQKC